MGFLDRLFGRSSKTIVIALDGVPYSFLREMHDRGEFEHLGAPDFRQMSSVYPTISSVAWSTFMTGKNPGKHGIFGFVDRKPGDDDVFIPNGKEMKAQSLWSYLSDKKKEVFVMNVPLTYPPEEVNGRLVSGFLCPDLENGTYPPSFSRELKKMNYKIDVDSSLALQNLDKFMDDVHETFEARKEAMFNYLDKDWDFFMVQFMETDRINHFMMGYWRDEHSRAKQFLEFYKKVDKMIGEIKKRTEEENLIIMSDHGFTGIKKEVQLNYWLNEKGYLEDAKEFGSIGPDTKAFSLLPGRIYINLKQREARGGVSKEDYETLRNQLIDDLKDVRTPENEKVIQKVFKREEIYSGPYAKRGADIIVHPKKGYDLKAEFGASEFMDKGLRNGMHTYGDAFIYFNDKIKEEHDISNRTPNIIDLFPTILDLMKIKKPKGLDGRSLI